MGEISDFVFGKSSPDASELHVPGGLRPARPKPPAKQKPPAKPKQEGLSTKEKIAYATNAGGMVAGPAALGLAVRAAKDNDGGMPRQALRRFALGKPITGDSYNREAGNKKFVGDHKVYSLPKGGLRAKALKIADALDKPATKKAKVASLAAAGSLVTLQGMNWAGDTIATQMFKDKAKEKKQVTKSGHDLTWKGEISKTDDDKRQVFGWCSLTHVDGQPVIDRQGDYIPLEEVEKAAYDYVIKSRKGGDEHRREGEQPLHTSDMIESFVVTPEKLEAMGMEPDAMPSGWWIGFKVNDDEQWSRVKKGQRQHFSIHGRGRRTERSEDEIMAKHTRSRR